MARRALVSVLLLLVGVGCPDTGERAAPTGIDAACLPMPVVCPTQLDCTVTVRRDDGARVCSGSSCCETFCAENGCDFCCGRP